MRFATATTLFAVAFCIIFVNADKNKYSREANSPPAAKQKEVDFRNLHKPFRMAKLNVVWSKAQQRLTEPKLKSLYSDLTIQDKEEITYKKIKSEGRDKEGLREAELRRKLLDLMGIYGLAEHFDEVQDKKKVKDHMIFNESSDSRINKSLFKDKKLALLWSRAETAGFTSEELSALREEFTHHQEKVDQYYQLLDKAEERDQYGNVIDEEERDRFNDIETLLNTNDVAPNKDYLHKANLVRDHHRDLRDNYDRLNRITAKGPNNKEFLEPKVQDLWRMANLANFTHDELESLKVELHHYEARLLKLRHLHADQVSQHDTLHGKIAATGDKMDHFAESQQMIKKHTRKVEKLHADLADRILERHTEL